MRNYIAREKREILIFCMYSSLIKIYLTWLINKITTREILNEQLILRVEKKREFFTFIYLN